MKTQTKNLGRALGWLTLMFLAVILYLGLWPYNFGSPAGTHGGAGLQATHWMVLPPNEVEWLKNEPGLHFGDYGSILSTADFTAGPPGAGCALEVWLEPALTRDVTTTLAFSTQRNPLQFRMRQFDDSLVVNLDTIDEKSEIQDHQLWVSHIFKEHQRLLITLSSGANGTAVYTNGKLKRNYEGFHLTVGDFTGRLVFGDSPLGHQFWSGNMRGLAIYANEISADRVKENYEVWSSGAEFPADVATSATALYRFREGTGNVIRSSVPGAPDLVIPATLETMRPILLKAFWKEYDNRREYWADVLVNILAFVPFGFLFYGYLTVRRNAKRAFWKALAAGFLVSLTIELGQYYLPMRNSGTTDLITNTTGAGLGALLFGIERVRRIVELGASKWPFARGLANG